jgi:hypothetical protein
MLLFVLAEIREFIWKRRSLNFVGKPGTQKTLSKRQGLPNHKNEMGM